MLLWGWSNHLRVKKSRLFRIFWGHPVHPDCSGYAVLGIQRVFANPEQWCGQFRKYLSWQLSRSCWTAFVFSTVVGAHEQSILILCLDQWVITVFGDLLEALIAVETKQEISWWSSHKADGGPSPKHGTKSRVKYTLYDNHKLAEGSNVNFPRLIFVAGFKGGKGYVDGR